MREKFSEIIRYGGGYNSSRPTLANAGDFLATGSAEMIFTGEGRAESYAGFLTTTVSSPRVIFNFLDATAGLGSVASVVRNTGGICTITSGSKTVTSSGAIFTSADLYKLVYHSTAFPATSSVYITKVNSTTSIEVSVAAAASATFATLYIFEPSPRGSVFPSIGRSLWYVGDTLPLYYDGASLGVNASTTLQFKLYAAGSYGTTRTAGLAAPSVPTIAAQAGGTKLQNKKYSVMVTRIRSVTGAESNASPQSATVTPLTTDYLRVTLANDVSDASQDKWGYYFTKADEGDTGPHFKYVELADSALSGVAPNKYYDFHFRDGDLQSELAPYDNNPPPTGVFAAQLGDCMAVIGCYGDSSGVTAASPGSAVAVSKRGFYESYPARSLLALPEPPTAVMSRAGENVVYIWGRNSLSALTPDPDALATTPLKIEPVWSNVGIYHHHSAVFADGTVYAYTSQLGLVRMGPDGRPESAFAARVYQDLKAFSPSATVLGYDPGTQTVTVASGAKVLTYNKAFDVWGAPLRSTGTAAGTYTTDGGMKLVAADTIGITTYAYGQSSSGTTWVARSDWKDGGGPERNKTLTTLFVSLDTNSSTNTVTVKVYKNMDTSSAAYTTTFTPTGSPQHKAVFKINVKNVKSYCVEISGSGSGCHPIECRAEGVAQPIRA
jgi:hypothetical protein